MSMDAMMEAITRAVQEKKKNQKKVEQPEKMACAHTTRVVSVKKKKKNVLEIPWLTVGVKVILRTDLL